MIFQCSPVNHSISNLQSHIKWPLYSVTHYIVENLTKWIFTVGARYMQYTSLSAIYYGLSFSCNRAGACNSSTRTRDAFHDWYDMVIDHDENSITSSKGAILTHLRLPILPDMVPNNSVQSHFTTYNVAKMAYSLPRYVTPHYAVRSNRMGVCAREDCWNVLV